MSSLKVNTIEPLTGTTVDVLAKKSIKVVNTIAELLTEPGTTEYFICVLGENEISDSGGGIFYFDVSRPLVNDGVLCFNGWTKLFTRTSSNKVCIKEFGAIGDGVVNDAPAFNSAIVALNSIGGGVLTVPSGIYKINSTIFMMSNITVECDSGTFFDCESSSANSIIEFTGTTDSEYSLSSSVDRGNSVISVSGGAPFSVGDIVHLVSYNSVFAAGAYNLGYHATDNCYYAEWNIIAQDYGAGVYRLAHPFEFPGWTTSAKVKKVNPVKNSNWLGGTFNRTTSGAAGDTIIRSNWAINCLVDGTKFIRGNRKGASIEFRKSWNCCGKNLVSENDPTYFYNYAVDHSGFNRFKTIGTQDCGFINLIDSFGGQVVDFSYSNSSAPYCNIRSYCINGTFYRNYEGLTSHQGCYQEQWVGNTISGCYDDGIVSRGYMPTIQNNQIYSIKNITSESATSAGAFIIGRQYTISTSGTTDFVAIGAANNTPGTDFVATGVGSGTGTAIEATSYGIKLLYGGARQADISNNVIRGFYCAIGIGGSSTLGQWTNINCSIHDNEISSCFVGFTTETIGNNNSMRFITYQNNHHSQLGRFVVWLPSYVSGVTIKNNVMDGAFTYTGSDSYVAFIRAETNCPIIEISNNKWNRTKGSNSDKTKYFAFISEVTDTTAFPESDCAAQTFVTNNNALFDTDASFTYYNILKGTTYYQYGTPINDVYFSEITSGVAKAIPNQHRIFYLNVTTEGNAATDDLDQLVPYTNCYFKEGDIVYLRTVSNSNDVVIRDVATSGASTNGFQTPSNVSIVMGTANDTVMCVHNGSNWAVISQSING